MEKAENNEQKPVMRVLAVGIDTLVAGILPTDGTGAVIQTPLPVALQEELNHYKELAQTEEEKVPTRWVFAGSNLLMLEKAGAPFKWILEHPKIKVSISRGLRVPLWGEVRFSSEYLWEHRDNYEQAVSDVWLFLSSIFGEHIYLQASGVDLAKDFEGWNVGAVPLDALRERFITRAASDDALPDSFPSDGLLDGPDSIKRRWRRVTGLPFGKRNAAVSAVLYDKTHEIRYHSQEKKWMYDVWPNEKDSETGRPLLPVWRLEIRLKRKALHEGDIESIWDVLARLADLWTYAVGHIGGDTDGFPDGWLRYVEPSADTNRARWPVAPEWEVLQAPFVPTSALPAPAQPEETSSPFSLAQPEETSSPFSLAQPEEASSPSFPAAPSPLPSAPAPALRSLTPFIRRRKYEVNLRRAVAAIAGYAATTEAWRQNGLLGPGCSHGDTETDISVTFHFLFQEVQCYLEEKDRDFGKMVQKRQARYHLAVVPAAVA